MGKKYLRVLLIIVTVFLLAVLLGCSNAGGTGDWHTDEETLDPNELSDYVDDYVIDVQEDEIIIID